MYSPIFAPLLVSAITWLLVVAIASLCPTYSYIHIFLYLCGTPSGHLFSVAFLAWAFYVCRFIWRLISFCVGHHVNVKRRRKKVKYSSLPTSTTTEDGNIELSVTNAKDKQGMKESPMAPPEEEECKSTQDKKPSSPLSRWIVPDLAAMITLYFGLCLFAYIFWSPPTFPLESIPSSKEADDAIMLTFPPNFTFGASTSSYQVEGNNFNNQWSKFENDTGIERCGAAADVWNKFESDLDNLILAEDGLHLDALRISVEWSRIEPQQGVFDEAALDRYASWVSLLRKNGIKPMVTLHHFTNPLWFEDLGAFENDTAPSLIEPFVRKVVERLGSQVDRWITINEIMVYAGMGYWIGDFPPGRKGELTTMLKVVRNMLRCHETMYNIIKEHDKDASVSIAKSASLYHPMSYVDLISIVTASISDLWYNAMPIRVLERQGTIDYIGMNNYMRMKVGKFGTFMGFVYPPEEQSEMGWDLDSQVLYQAVKQYNSYIPELDIIITEHGAADGDVPDVRRQRSLKESLVGLAVAINEENLPVRGYYHWSLMDNFEWALGYGPKFGLYRIDLPNDQERNLTEGGELYREIIDLRKISL